VRPYWKGYLKLALVSCPIALHAACSTAERTAVQVGPTANEVAGRLRTQPTSPPAAAAVNKQSPAPQQEPMLPSRSPRVRS
jgi:non-homologous end joining protein Ku